MTAGNQRNWGQRFLFQFSLHQSNSYGDTQWYLSTTLPLLPIDTDHASMSRASLFSNHNLSTHGGSHFDDAYRANILSGPSLVEGLPNRVITASNVSPICTETYAVCRFILIYVHAAKYDSNAAMVLIVIAVWEARI